MATESALPKSVSESPATELGRPVALEVAAPAVKRRRRVLLFEHSDRWFSRLLKLGAALHEGFWLGCLSKEDLNAITDSHYERSREYASVEHNLRGFFDWESGALGRYFRPGSRILVAAAGGGREVVALRKAGFHADGFECSPSLLRASQAVGEHLGVDAGVVPCSPNRVPAGEAVYEGLIVGWSAYTHIPTRACRVAFLRSLRQRSLRGSPVLVSFFTREASSGYETVSYRAACVFRALLRGRKEVAEIGDHLAWSFTHSFVREELEAELRASGFRPVHYSEVGEGHAVGIAE